LYETALGFKDLEDFMQGFWEAWALSKGKAPPSREGVDIANQRTFHLDPANLLVMGQTWQNADVGKQEPYNGNFEKAMAAIKAKTLVLPAKTDLYFP
jgi:homoserine O-acetyltransferase